MEKVKVLVVGSGVAGATKHVPYFQSCPEVEVVGMVDPDLARARKTAAEHGIPGAFAALPEAMAQSGAKMVSVCTPPQTHKELAIYALEHGADVLVEKPFTVTIEEAREIIAAAQRTGRKLSVVHQNKFNLGVLQMSDIVARGEAGRVLHLGLTWLTNGDKDRMVIDPNFWCHKIPGGRWAESLPHQLYIAYALVGDMKLMSVAARKTTQKWPWMAADEVDVVLESRDGYVNIRMSANPEEEKRRINVLHGTKGSYMFSYKFAMPLRERPGEMRDLSGPLPARLNRAIGRLAGKKRGPKIVPAHEAVIHRFVAYALHGGPNPTTPEEALAVEELTDQFGREFEKIVHRSV